MKGRGPITPEAAEGLAIQALTFIAGDGERLGRFLAVTGIGPAEIRDAACEPGFLAGVLKGLTPKDCLQSAVAVGACSVEAADATSGVPAWHMVEQRMRHGWPTLPSCINLG